MSELEKLIKELPVRAAENDTKGLAKLVDDIVALLPKEPGTIAKDLAREALKSLRKYRQFGHMHRLAAAFIDDGASDPQVYRQLAQSMIEQGDTVPALSILQTVVKEAEGDDFEWGEAKAALGRAWKDQAVRTRAARPGVSVRATRNAFTNYRAAFKNDPARYYQGINMVAIAAWDKGNALSKDALDQGAKAADAILEHLTKLPKDKLDAWQKATIGEALVAKGKLHEAGKWFSEYVNDKEIDAFKLSGTIRQLNELWNVSDLEGGIELITPLRAKLGATVGGQFSVSTDELARMAKVSEDNYQRILGKAGTVTYTWMQKAFEVARSVALILKNGNAHGTGYVVKGSQLDPRLGEEMYILTNSHVVSEPKLHHDAATVDEASVGFEVLKKDGYVQEHQVEKVVWQSPPDRHDAAILKLTPKIPQQAAPVLFSNALPPLPGEHRVFIIGHPGGREISFSFQDNLLLDYEHKYIGLADDPSPCRIHYRTPTEPGSSGSPIFNANWRTIGIHHSGDDEMPKLNGQDGVYAANEGIWIESIKRALAKVEKLNE